MFVLSGREYGAAVNEGDDDDDDDRERGKEGRKEGRQGIYQICLGRIILFRSWP